MQSAQGKTMGIELIYLWNGFPNLKPEVLQMMELMVESAKGCPCTPGTEVDTDAVCLLLSGAIKKNLGKLVEAEADYRAVEALESQLKHDVWTVPHAFYEMGVMLLNDPARKAEASKYLKRAQKFSKDFNFEIRLRFRLHAARRLADE